MPLSLADVLSAQAGGGPQYEGGPDANVTLGGVLTALGFGGPSWLDAARRQTGADIAAYQLGGVPELMADTGQTQELAGGFGGGAIAGPIKAYHGSPYDFAKFDLSKIGTGEGAQAYGHGLYFAGNENVARTYRPGPVAEVPQQYSSEIRSAIDMVAGQGGIEEAKAGLQRQIDVIGKNLAKATEQRDQEHLAYSLHNRQQALAALESGDVKINDRGKMYEVNINAEPGQFLNWDAPLSQQGAPVLKNLNEMWGLPSPEAQAGMTGQETYRTLALAALPGAKGKGLERVTNAMSEAGIPGIRYLDQGSRVTPAQAYQTPSGEWATIGGNATFPTREAAIASQPQNKTSNYVVFNPDIVDILKKYGLAGLTMGGVLTAAGQGPAPSQ